MSINQDGDKSNWESFMMLAGVLCFIVLAIIGIIRLLPWIFGFFLGLIGWEF